MKSKQEVVQGFFDEVWTRENTSMIKEVFVPDSDVEKTAAGLARDEKLSPDDFIGFQQALLAQVKNMVVTIDQSLEEGDWIAMRCSVVAESRKSGNPVKMGGTGWARVTDGKIREAHNFFDFLTFFEHLELLPDNTMAQCLEGRSLRG